VVPLLIHHPVVVVATDNNRIPQYLLACDANRVANPKDSRQGTKLSSKLHRISPTINLFTQPSLHIKILRLLLDDNNPWLALLMLFEEMGWLGLRELWQD
jgi:hypothetical protein